MDWWNVIKEFVNDHLYENEEHQKEFTLDIIDELETEHENKPKSDAISTVFNIPNVVVRWNQGLGAAPPQQLGAVENPRVREPTEEERQNYIEQGLARENQNIEVIDERDIVTGKERKTTADSMWFMSLYYNVGDQVIGDLIGVWWLHPSSKRFQLSTSDEKITPQELVQLVNNFIRNEE
mgnify:CR=1 FL=1